MKEKYKNFPSVCSVAGIVLACTPLSGVSRLEEERVQSESGASDQAA